MLTHYIYRSFSISKNRLFVFGRIKSTKEPTSFRRLLSERGATIFLLAGEKIPRVYDNGRVKSRGAMASSFIPEAVTKIEAKTDVISSHQIAQFKLCRSLLEKAQEFEN